MVLLSNSAMSMMMAVMYSSTVVLATIDCNHASLDGGYPLVADFCHAVDGYNSVMLACHDGQGFLREWALSTDCEGNHEFEADLSDFGYEVVCDADPCHVAVFEDYSGDSSSSSSSESDDYNGTDSTDSS